MGKFELYAELAAISVMTDELTEKTRLITLLVDKYQYRDDIEAECVRRDEEEREMNYRKVGESDYQVDVTNEEDEL